MSADVIDINKNEPHFTVLALCLMCDKRWIGLVIAKTSLFGLECPRCGMQESFASFVPSKYLEQHK